MFLLWTNWHDTLRDSNKSRVMSQLESKHRIASICNIMSKNRSSVIKYWKYGKYRMLFNYNGKKCHFWKFIQFKRTHKKYYKTNNNKLLITKKKLIFHVLINELNILIKQKYVLLKLLSLLIWVFITWKNRKSHYIKYSDMKLKMYFGRCFTMRRKRLDAVAMLRDN